MEFDFTDEQQTVRELARQILEAEATVERVKQAEQSSDWIDDALWRQLAGANLLGLAIPEEHSGMGYGFAELCVLLEELGRVVAPTPALATLVLGALPIAEFGTAAQRGTWLPRVCRGDALLTAALVDAESAEVSAPGARARSASQGWLLDGVKRLVPLAHRADAILVPATVEGGVGIFLVDPEADGVERVRGDTSTGEPVFDVTLTGVSVSEDARLGGAEADGAAIASWLEERALVGLAALQVGVSDGALRLTANYVKEREQFGVPIGSFQAVQHRCADGFIDLEAMRWTMWRAAWRLGEGLPATREAWVAKFWASEAGSRIANAGLHLHGGLGSDVDYPIHRYFLWSKALELGLGGAGPQLARLGRDMAATGPQESI